MCRAHRKPDISSAPILEMIMVKHIAAEKELNKNAVASGQSEYNLGKGQVNEAIKARLAHSLHLKGYRQ